MASVSRAPGRFSTITRQPSASANSFATMRLTTSGGDPAPAGTTMRMAFGGADCALVSFAAATNERGTQRTRLAENQKKFNQLPPQKQQEMKRAAENWQRLTPQQQSHIRNDVLPRWQQLPADRQRAIQNRLGVLQNMPESARNRHLNDPNFTRGMSEDDRRMLQDLSHEHVGAPDRPQEQ